MTRREGDPKSSLVEMCHENFIGAYEYLARIVPGGAVERMGGLTAVRTGMPGSSFNVVFGLNPPNSLAQAREGIRRLFLRTNTEFQIVTLPETLDELEPILQEMDLTDREVIPGMALEPIPDARPDPPKDLQIRPASSPEEVADLLLIGAVGFEAPPNYFDVWKPGFLAGAAGPWSRGANYVGYVGGKPAATSIRVTTGDVAGVYFVSTLPEFRRRGFGESMTWRAVADGRTSGCRLSYLQASKMGRPIYERMGYRVIEEYSEWKRMAPMDGQTSGLS
ncbi:MAG: GNAT family N-acetyltransferase [Nitrososphaerales archaeon]